MNLSDSPALRFADSNRYPIEYETFGERMRQAGATLLADTLSMGAIGLWEALPLVLPTLRLQRRLRRWLEQHPPDGAVLIDYMGANVNLGLRLRRRFHLRHSWISIA